MKKTFRLVWQLFGRFSLFWSIRNVSNWLLQHENSVQFFKRTLYLTAETVQELRYCLQNAVDTMRSTDHPVTAIASGSELFLRFITLATLDTPVIR